MVYGKYEFDTIPEILTDEENPVDGSVVELGYLIETKGTYDEEGNVITTPVMSTKIAVDILWNNEVDEALEPNRIYPITPSHYIGGMEELYLKTI